MIYSWIRNRLTKYLLILIVVFSLSGCKPGQLLGPTFTPTLTMTPTATPIPRSNIFGIITYNNKPLQIEINLVYPDNTENSLQLIKTNEKGEYNFLSVIKGDYQLILYLNENNIKECGFSGVKEKDDWKIMQSVHMDSIKGTTTLIYLNILSKLIDVTIGQNIQMNLTMECGSKK